MATFHSLAAIEAAINHWRARSPAQGEARVLSTEVDALAEPYAFMILDGRQSIDESELTGKARAALEAWRVAAEAAAGVSPDRRGGEGCRE